MPVSGHEYVFDVDGTLAHMQLVPPGQIKVVRETKFPWNDTYDLSPSGKEHVDLSVWWYEVGDRVFTVHVRPGLLNFGVALRKVGVERVFLASVNSTMFVSKFAEFLTVTF